jgi:broad specificity phosphatase PhoE
MKRISPLWTLVFLAFAVLIFAGLPAHTQDLLSDEALITALRQGGYNIYFRHAATDWSQNDQVAAAADWTSCDPARMRQLSAEGRTVARRIGAAIRRLDIPIDQVLASEYCRTRETAELMKLGSVRTTREIINMRVAEFVGGRSAVINRARRLLATPPQAGTNTILVAHGNLMLAATGAYGSEASAGIYLPQADGTIQLVTQLTAEDWERLAGNFGRPEGKGSHLK